jgi:hypothetical protein
MMIEMGRRSAREKVSDPWLFSCRFLGVSTRSFQAPSQSRPLRLRQGLTANAPNSNDTVNHAHSGSRSPAARFAELATSPISWALEPTFPPRSSLIRLRVSEARESRQQPAAQLVEFYLRATTWGRRLPPESYATNCAHGVDGDGDAPFPDLAPPREPGCGPEVFSFSI